MRQNILVHYTMLKQRSMWHVTVKYGWRNAILNKLRIQYVLKKVGTIRVTKSPSHSTSPLCSVLNLSLVWPREGGEAEIGQSITHSLIWRLKHSLACIIIEAKGTVSHPPASKANQKGKASTARDQGPGLGNTAWRPASDKAVFYGGCKYMQSLWDVKSFPWYIVCNVC